MRTSLLFTIESKLLYIPTSDALTQVGSAGSGAEMMQKQNEQRTYET